MLIFDQLKKDDPHLRFLAIIVLAGILILGSGLWWVQLVSTKYFQEKLEVQSTRTIRIPAIRGKILDRNGRPLAENRPVYSVNLYLEELSKDFQKAYNTRLALVQTNFHLQAEARQKQLGRKLNTQEKKEFLVSDQLKNQLRRQTRYEVTTSLLAGLSLKLKQPISLTQSNFDKWYDRSRVLPMPILSNLNPSQVACFEEQSSSIPGIDLEVQSLRFYPYGSIGAHLLGYLAHDDESKDDRDYNYRLEDFAGQAGIEKIYDEQLHGEAGARSVVINNYGYRQSETIESPPSPGQNVVLTIDADIQKAADIALERMSGQSRHGAVVVMDVRNGDVLALSSAPTYNPNHFVQRPDSAIWQQEWSRWTNEDLQLQMNHAVQGLYPPGSIFKIVVGLAGLELGTLNPREIVSSPGYFPMPGRAPIRDTAPAGDYDFDRALALSCNYYFITNGLKPGVLPKIVTLGRRLHFGERTGLLPKFEDRGYFPKPNDVLSSTWRKGNTANLSIGQDKIAVTPLQIAVMISAIANGGTVFSPRLVSRIESYRSDQTPQVFPEHQIRDSLDVSQNNLRIVHDAMRADVDRAVGESTGHAAYVSGMVICGKTGTAQVENREHHVDKSIQVTWFGSFAAMAENERPKYAVIVMLAGGSSGGGSCAPIAHEVYVAIQQMERKAAAKPATLAQTR